MQSNNYQLTALNQLIADNEMISNKIQSIGRRFIGRCEKVKSELEPMGCKTHTPECYNSNTKYFTNTSTYRDNLIKWFQHIHKGASVQDIALWIEKDLAKEQNKLNAIKN